MKIVRESLYNFHKTGDVKSSLNIGIRIQIAAWLDEMGVENYTINEDLTIDVNGNVFLNDKDLTEFPSFIKFRNIEGRFMCERNKLISLEGSPLIVKGSFDCSGNLLTSLNGAPQEVGGYFDCSGNKLKSLSGVPKKIGVHFDCSGNLLTSLNGAPQEVGGYFDCSENKLKSLSGVPKKIGVHFYCSENSNKFTEHEIKAVCNVKGMIYV